jgi:hypothetical protein
LTQRAQGGGGIVSALGTFGVKVRANLERIAPVRPQAFIVAGTGVLIEVAILHAAHRAAAGDRGIESIFCVLTRGQAVWIVAVGEPVAVVVHAVAAGVHVVLARGDQAGRTAVRSSVSPDRLAVERSDFHLVVTSH